MDKYEQLLEEKINNAKCSLMSLCVDDVWKGADNSQVGKELTGEIKAYQDALITYRTLKMRRKI